MTDKASPVTETHREVGRRRIAAGEARTALIRRRCDAPVEDVWDACTSPDRLNRWFLEVMAICASAGPSSWPATQVATSCAANYLLPA
jgi:hypothetical protein